MKAALLSREYEKTQTTGHLMIFDEMVRLVFQCVTIEPQWNNNEKNNSCIPEGIYIVKKHYSPTFKECFKIQDVKDRSEVLFHAGNFRKDTRGCILPGDRFTDINGDGFKDVVNSKMMLNKMLLMFTDGFELEIRKQ